jgi:hypothetical protein
MTSSISSSIYRLTHNVCISNEDPIPSILQCPIFEDFEIGLVISVGCDFSHIHSSIENWCFPSIIDLCHIYLIDFWLLLYELWHNNFQDEKQQGKFVLIHCVFGQSRSISTAIAMILLDEYHSLKSLMDRGERVEITKENLNIERILSLTKSIKSDISINPSFIAQLFILSKLLQLSLQLDTSISKLQHPWSSLYQLLHHSQLTIQTRSQYQQSIGLNNSSSCYQSIIEKYFEQTSQQDLRNNEMQSNSRSISHSTNTPQQHHHQSTTMDRNLCCKYCKQMIAKESQLLYEEVFSILHDFVYRVSDDYWQSQLTTVTSSCSSSSTAISAETTTTTTIATTTTMKPLFIMDPSIFSKHYYVLYPIPWLLSSYKTEAVSAAVSAAAEEKEDTLNAKNHTSNYEDNVIVCPNCQKEIGEYRSYQSISLISLKSNHDNRLPCHLILLRTKDVFLKKCLV